MQTGQLLPFMNEIAALHTGKIVGKPSRDDVGL